MNGFISSVSPKGQVTIPAEIRDRLGIKPKDKVAFMLDGEDVKITLVESRLARGYQAVPALKQPRTLREMTDVAWEEHAAHVASEGR